MSRSALTTLVQLDDRHPVFGRNRTCSAPSDPVMKLAAPEFRKTLRLCGRDGGLPQNGERGELGLNGGLQKALAEVALATTAPAARVNMRRRESVLVISGLLSFWCVWHIHPLRRGPARKPWARENFLASLAGENTADPA